MAIPPSITSGVDAVWTDAETVDVFGDAVTSTTHTLTYYFRLNTAGEGVTATAVAYNSGWKTTLSAAVTGAMDASPDWYFQAVATKISDGTIQAWAWMPTKTVGGAKAEPMSLPNRYTCAPPADERCESSDWLAPVMR